MYCAQCAGDGEFWCGMENQIDHHVPTWSTLCIDQSQICDGRQDCPSGQDIVERHTRNDGHLFFY